MGKTNATTQVFISYSSKERVLAERIQIHLESKGFKVWRDQSRLETDWSKEIAHALAESDLLCLLWSQDSSQSKWVQHEWLTARALEKYIALCLFPDFPELPDPLKNIHGIDFSDVDQGLEELTERLKKRTHYQVAFDYSVLPAHSYIPFNPNPEFVGRHQDLLQLYLKMIGNLQKIGINQVGAVGMGGIGKTQLVAEFGYRYAFAFDHVFWVQAQNPKEWVHELVVIARDRLQISINQHDHPENDQQYLFALQRYLKTHPNTLLIFDNVEDPRSLNDDLLLLGLTALSLGSNLLFTTRRRFHIPGVEAHHLNILSVDHALALLVKYQPSKDPTELQHARTICEAVGCLPLAIILAGAFLRNYRSQTPYADYHDELKRNKLDVIDLAEITKAELATRHTAALQLTLDSQWRMIENDQSQLLFKLVGQFPEAAIIPERRLHILSGIPPGKTKLHQPFQRALDELLSMNLMERLEETAHAIRLHPLIRDYAFKLIDDRERGAFKHQAAQRLKQYYFHYSNLAEVLSADGVNAVRADLTIGTEWWGEDDPEQFDQLSKLKRIINLSGTTLIEDPAQLAAQIWGHLNAQERTQMAELIQTTLETKKDPWLRSDSICLTPASTPIEWIYQGKIHVHAVVLAESHDRLAIGNDSGDIIIYQLSTGFEVKEIPTGPKCYISSGMLGPDGTIAYFGIGSIRDGGGVIAVNLASLKIEWQSKLDDSIKDLSLTGDHGKIIAIGDDNMWLLNANNGVLKKSSGIKVNAVVEIGNMLLLGKKNGLFTATMGKTRPVRLNWWKGDVQLMRQLNDGRLLLCNDHGDIFIVALEQETFQKVGNHGSGIDSLALSDDDTILFTGGRDGKINSWHLINRQRIAGFQAHVMRVNALALSHQALLSGSKDCTVKVWDLKKVLNKPRGILFKNRLYELLALSEDGQFIAFKDNDDSINLVSCKDWKAYQKPGQHWKPRPKDIKLLAFDQAGHLISVDGKGSIKLYKGKLKKHVKTGIEIHYASIDPEHAIILAWNHDQLMTIRYLEESVKSFSFEFLSYALVINNGQSIVMDGDEVGLRVIGLETGQTQKTLKPPLQFPDDFDERIKIGIRNSVVHMVKSRNGDLLSVARRSGHIELWNLKDGTFIGEAPSHLSHIHGLALSGTLKIGLSAGLEDRELRVWSCQTGKLLCKFTTETGWWGCDMSEKGRIVATDDSGLLIFFELMNLEEP